MLRKILGTGDDARLAKGRQAHGLREIEFRILERRQSDQLVFQRGQQIGLGNVKLIA